MNSLKMNIIMNIATNQKLINELNGFKMDINDLVDDDEVMTDNHREFHKYLSEHLEGAKERAHENISAYESMLEKLI